MSRTYAIIGSIIFHAIIIAILLMLSLDFSADKTSKKADQWPPVDSSMLLFDGEYVAVGDPAAMENTEQAPEAQQEVISETDLSLTQPQPEAIVSELPSPAKAQKVEKPTDKVQPQKPIENAANAQQEKQQAQSKQIAANVGAAFSGTGGKSSSPAKGSPTGNAATGATSGIPGTSLAGRTLEHYDKPKSYATGSITVAIKVNQKGQVIEASYSGGKGAASSNEQTKKNCIAAARNSQFSVSYDAPAMQSGSITYNFK